MRRNYRHWTEDEMARLEHLIAAGENPYAIGRALGRSASSVRNKIDDIFGRKFHLGRICADCPRRIRDCNVSGRCKSCSTAHSNRLPHMKAKRVEGWKKRMADPVKYADLCRVAKANSRKAMADPVKRAAAQERARKIYERYLATPEMRNILQSPEMRARIGRAVSECRMAWCPLEYREMYHDIRRKVQCSAADARAVVLEQVKIDRARMSPFERQMLALKEGAKLVANDAQPRFGNAIDHGEAKWARLTA